MIFGKKKELKKMPENLNCTAQKANSNEFEEHYDKIDWYELWEMKDIINFEDFYSFKEHRVDITGD